MHEQEIASWYRGDMQHVLKAISFAARAHRGLFRKDGETP